MPVGPRQLLKALEIELQGRADRTMPALSGFDRQFAVQQFMSKGRRQAGVASEQQAAIQLGVGGCDISSVRSDSALKPHECPLPVSIIQAGTTYVLLFVIV